MRTDMKRTEEEKTYYSVKEVCERYAITRKTLFYYDRNGLLEPSARTGPQLHKLYDADACIRLEEILKYRHAGLQISEIRELLEEHAERKKILQNALNRIIGEKQQKTEQIRILQEMIRDLS